MFQQTFVSEASDSRRPLGVLFSLSLQVLAVVSIILLQLLYTPPIPTAQLRALLVVPPPPVSQPKSVAAAHPAPSTPARRTFTLTAPIRIPKTIARADIDSPALPDTGVVGTATELGSGNDPLIGITNAAPPAVAPPQAAPQARARGPMRLGGNVAAANIIRQVQPVYPPLARSARVEGAVEFTAIIDKTGRVVNLQLQHGHPLLVNAAREAILQWRYKPTTLNGESVDVVTTITVNFHLSN